MNGLLPCVSAIFNHIAAAAEETASETSNGQVLAKIYEYLAKNSINILYAVVIFIVGRWVAKLAAGLIEKAMNKTKIDPTISTFVNNAIYVGLLVFIVLAALARLGVETTSFIAVLGAAGLAVGLALQGSLANFASGVLIVIFKPIRVGDFVEIGGVKGTVKSIQIFNTILAAPDNVRVFIPNASITGGNILNYSANGTRRVDLVIGVSYGDDLKKTRQVIQQVLSADKRILPEPAPTVAVSELADSSVNFVVRPWVRPDDYWAVYFDMTEKIKIALDENGITIPFPQRDVHIKNGKNTG